VQGVTGGEPLEDWLKRLMTQDDEILRTSGFLKLMEALKTPEEIQQALEAINSIGGRNRWRGGVGMREGSMLLQKWTQLDPKGAMGYAQSQKGEQEKWGATTVVMRTWARINPDEAIAFAKEAPPSGNPQDGNWSIAAVVGQLAKTDLDRAMQLSSTQDVSRARGRMMESVLDELVSQRGDEAARQSILSLPEGSFRDNMASQLARRLADNDGPGTAQWVMNSLPAGDARNRALAEVMGQWADDDPVAAGNFLKTIPASKETDSARERYAYEALRRDPEGALAWAGTITADEQRTKAVEGLLRQWVRRDRSAAQNWMATAQLPDDFKARVMRN
jgi:hypothetical protein